MLKNKIYFIIMNVKIPFLFSLKAIKLEFSIYLNKVQCKQ